MKKIIQTGLIILISGTLSCINRNKDQSEVPGNWLKGNETQKFETVSKHLRGFDIAMVETAYRYQELYWTGKDHNWGYAEYQSKKIRTAIENGLERRPKRAGSAKSFLNVALPDMDSAIASRDTMKFRQAFNALTSHCNACHVLEEVPFIKVSIPSARHSPGR